MAFKQSSFKLAIFLAMLFLITVDVQVNALREVPNNGMMKEANILLQQLAGAGDVTCGRLCTEHYQCRDGWVCKWCKGGIPTPVIPVDFSTCSF